MINNTLNESLGDSLLSTLFFINRNDHKSINGKQEKALSKDGADFALAFPIQWDKLGPSNVKFYVDGDFYNHIPKNGSFLDKPDNDTAGANTEQRANLRRYATDSFVANSEKSAEFKSMKSKAMAALRRAADQYSDNIDDYDDMASYKEAMNVIKTTDAVRDFLEQKVAAGKENVHVTVDAHDMIVNWKDVVPTKSMSKVVVSFIDKVIEDYMGTEPELFRGKQQYPVKVGVRYNRSTGDHDYLGKYETIEDMSGIPLDMLMSEVEKSGKFDKYAIRALTEAIASVEKSMNGLSYRFIKDRRFINEYSNIRANQFKNGEVGAFVKNSEAEDGVGTMKKISDECTELRTIYRNLLNSDDIKTSIEVSKLFTTIFNRAETLDGNTKGRVINTILDKITKNNDSIARTGDFSMLILMGSKLDIRYVVSDVYTSVGDDGGTYSYNASTSNKSVFGWGKGLPLTTVQDAMYRKYRSAYKSDAALNRLQAYRRANGLDGNVEQSKPIDFNLVSVEEIKNNIDNIQCAVYIGGKASNLVKDSGADINKVIIDNLSDGGGINISNSKGALKEYKISCEDIDAVKKYLSSKGIYKKKIVDECIIIPFNKDNEVIVKDLVSVFGNEVNVSVVTSKEFKVDGGNSSSVAEYLVGKGLPTPNIKNGSVRVPINKKSVRVMSDLLADAGIKSSEFSGLFDAVYDVTQMINMFKSNRVSEELFLRNYTSLFKDLITDGICYEYDGYGVEDNSVNTTKDQRKYALAFLAGQSYSILRKNNGNRYAFDKEVVFELSNKKEFGNKKLPAIYSILKDHVMEDLRKKINEILTINDVCVRMSADTDYVTLAQNVNDNFIKMRNRYDSAPHMTDREKMAHIGLRDGEGSHDEEFINYEDKNKEYARSVSKRNEIEGLISEFMSKKNSFSFAPKGYKTNMLIKSASDKLKADGTVFAKAEADDIKKAIVSQCVEASKMANRLESVEDKDSCLDSIIVYLKRVIGLVQATNDNLAGVNDPQECIDTISEVLLDFMDYSDRFSDTLGEYGIVLVAQGPGR